MLGNRPVLFNGYDASNVRGVWQTNGTAESTSELTGINGGWIGGINPYDFTAINGDVLFGGQDASGFVNLWVTNGDRSRDL